MIIWQLIALAQLDSLFTNYYTPFIKSKLELDKVDYKKELKELEDYTNHYREMRQEKRHLEVEIKKLENKNQELRDENRKLHNFLNVMLQTIKKFFNKLLHIGTEKDKDNVVEEITAYHKLDYYNDSDLHDIADGTSREEEINDYIYEQNYGNDKDYENYDIGI